MARTVKTGMVAAIALLVVTAGIYVTAKPYQQDRTLIELGLKSR